MANKIHIKYGNNVTNANLSLRQVIQSKYAVSAIIAKIITSEAFGFWRPKNTTDHEKFGFLYCASYGAI
jgi:hypothetical protein